MTLLNPTLLAAAVGVLVPIAIHLFGRPRPRRVRFPSLRLLRVAHRERRSRSRLQRLLALILRCAALVLLALALSLPVTDARRLSGLGRPAGRTAVVIDVSASMRDGAGISAPIARARIAAATVLDGITDSVLVATAGARARPIVGTWTPPAAEARAAITALRAGDERGALARSLGDLTRLGLGAGDTVVLLSDLQASSLAGAGGVPRGLRVLAVNVGAPVAANRGLVELSEPPGAPLRGRPLALMATVRAWGPESAGLIPLSAVAAEGAVLASAAAGVHPGQDTRAELELTPTAAGLLTGEVRLPADDFRPDDARLFALQVRERLRVLVCGDTAETRFLRAALDPFPAGDARSSIAVDLAAPSALTDRRLRAADVIALARPAALSAEQRARVGAAVKDGAGLLVFAGPGQEAGRLTAALADLGFAGVEVGAPQAHAEGRALAELVMRRPPLDAFAAPGGGDLSEPRFATTRALEVAEAFGPTVLARFDDGAPALVEGGAGRGRALLLAIAPDDTWSDLPRLPVYVALVHRLVSYLAAGRAPVVLPGAPGETVILAPPDLPAKVRLLGPDGTEIATERVAGGLRFTAQRRGIYRLTAGPDEIAVVAVNLDPAESEPAPATDAELAAALAPAEVTRVPGAELAAALGRLGAATDISGLCALLALLALAVDAGLVSRSASEAVGSDD